jgi:hypothetical protein
VASSTLLSVVFHRRGGGLYAEVPKWAPDEALETMRKVFEERLNIKVVIRKINW